LRVVILGSGRTGTSLVTALAEEGDQVTLIEIDRRQLDRLPASMSENDSIRIIYGDGTLSETLARAQLEDADLFISVTGQDTVNGLAAQKAKLIFEVGQVIARVRDPSLAELYSSLDLGIYCPTDVAVSNIVESVTREG